MDSDKAFKMGVATIHIPNVAIKHFTVAMELQKEEIKEKAIDAIKETLRSCEICDLCTQRCKNCGFIKDFLKDINI